MSSMSKSTEFGLVQIGIIVLTIATAVIHLVILGIVLGVNVLFILNGLGYLALLAAIYLPLEFLAGYRSLAKWVLMGYAALTVILYFAMNWPDVWGPLGIITKVIELVLIGLLWVDRENA
ncbi:MAG TPA: hypothetical protein VF177_10120 [Anaerolineae bacterium]